ncbi:DUF1835 domain-containing protein [Pseudobacter ginsenosidimutans]|uniref:Uncharacterized protein DUF1835 n=1 Tax=Pseudobacter ginsenosidimutans TaxID=661488 RepID=A0A4Q7N2L3_9BACT|nr:DUF1835 domain-containing protein [Pseudobacter ginsenosidimutans]QEC43691.1 DUF1835 domain-containing protein [Pseudobacter ginsenosidimutans]RZS75094.1 uncharacterized protein DUF1835 [Pseudobacter ginsenosidimutans]
MIHIVFNEPDVAVLQKAIELEESMQGDIVLIRDDYAVGPIADIYVGEGIEARKQWWKDVLAGGDYDGKVETDEVNDYKTVAELVGTMRRNPDEIIWIWAAQNKHDVSGYYWLLNYMAEFQGRVFILYLNNLPFINEKGLIFYPEWLSVIPPKEFLKARKLARPITLSEFEVDPDEWKKLMQENKGVRILEGGKKLAHFDYDFYDADLKKYITNDWQKASKIIHQFLSKNKQTTGDAYILWRLKQILAAGEYDVQGELKGMKDFEVKGKSAVQATSEQEQ